MLEKSGYEFDLARLFDLWAHGSVIRGWLVELVAKAFREHANLDELSPRVEGTGEGKWIVQLALDKEVWAPVIAEAEMAFYRARDEDSVAAKTVALLRNAFGGHPLHKK